MDIQEIELKDYSALGTEVETKVVGKADNLFKSTPLMRTLSVDLYLPCSNCLEEYSINHYGKGYCSASRLCNKCKDRTSLKKKNIGTCWLPHIVESLTNFRGVSLEGGKYVARHCGKNLGKFNTLEAAARARLRSEGLKNPGISRRKSGGYAVMVVFLAERIRVGQATSLEAAKKMQKEFVEDYRKRYL